MQKKSSEGVVWSASGRSYGHWLIDYQEWHKLPDETPGFAFQVDVEPANLALTHLHPDHDKFILVQDGALTITLFGQELEAGPGALVWIPKGVSNRHANLGTRPVKARFWITPARNLPDFFRAIDGALGSHADLCVPEVRSDNPSHRGTEHASLADKGKRYY